MNSQRTVGETNPHRGGTLTVVASTVVMATRVRRRARPLHQNRALAARRLNHIECVTQARLVISCPLPPHWGGSGHGK